jgi:YD repeat-containing protein
VRQTDPLNHASTFAYDGVGMITSSTDRDGRRIAYQYDAVNRLTAQTWYSDNTALATAITETLLATYDAAGNQLTGQNSIGIYTMTYDALNRVTSVAEPGGQALAFAYDKAGNRTVVQYTDGTLETSTYDAANQLTAGWHALQGRA